MSTEIITKRLHISGLTTPAITPTDLEKRLGAFGKVISLDGFGKRDALGQLRPFGYVTIEGRKADLARCVNVLSGTVWKGAKLRIGDAKPDFRERHALSASLPSPPSKKRRLDSLSRVGTQAPDMSLITPETAPTRGGWKVTEMGRIVRVMRMRPGRPLEPPRLTTSSAGDKKREIDGKASGKRKKRVKPPPTRARRRAIDPTRWDSVHLKGIWLDAEVVGIPETSAGLGGSEHGDRDHVADHVCKRVIQREGHVGNMDSSDAEGSDDEHDAESAVGFEDEDNDRGCASSSIPESVIPPLELTPFPTACPPVESTAENIIPQETLASLALLHSLFSDKDGDEGWGGRESLSDIEDAYFENKGSRQGVVQMIVDNDDAGSKIEEVPRAKFKDIEIGDSSDGVVSPPKSPPQPLPEPDQTIQGQTQVRLKDLFAPREDEAGFSLLGHLDLDFEEEDVLGISEPTHYPVEPKHASSVPRPIFTPHEQLQVPTLDLNLPFFFPLPPALRSRSSTAKNKPQDIFSQFPYGSQEKDKNDEPFFCTRSASEIYSQWEAQKGALTKEWKTRWREATKRKRGRDE